jgi:hypothetical protein
LKLVLDLAKDLADFVLDGATAGCPRLEVLQVWEELLIDEFTQVIADKCVVMVKSAVDGSGHRPYVPVKLLIK